MGTHVENTLASFRAAIDAGADAIEFDVRRCASGELVVFHDGTLSGLAGVDAAVADMPWNELRALTVTTPELPGQHGRICLLDEVLEDAAIAHALERGLEFCIEIKAREVAADVARWVLRHGLVPRVVMYSFHPEDLIAARREIPNVRTNFLFGERRENALNVAAEIGAWSINLETYDADADYIARARARGLQVSVGNTNEPADLRRVLELDAWGVHTNFPARAVAERERMYATGQGVADVGTPE